MASIDELPEAVFEVLAGFHGDEAHPEAERGGPDTFLVGFKSLEVAFSGDVGIDEELLAGLRVAKMLGVFEGERFLGRVEDLELNDVMSAAVKLAEAGLNRFPVVRPRLLPSFHKRRISAKNSPKLFRSGEVQWDMKIYTAFITTFLFLPEIWAESVSKDITIHDSSRDLSIECQVYYPEGGQSLPVILFSHGFGGDKTSFAEASSVLSGGVELGEADAASSHYKLVHGSRRIITGTGLEKEPYFRSPPGDKFLVDIEGANHFSFGGGRNGRTSGAAEIVQLVSLAFWNAYLKGDEAAKISLMSGDVLKEYADTAEIQSK